MGRLLADDLGGPSLVRRIDVGVQEADGDRRDPVPAETADGLCGYILLLKHRGTRLARLYSICVDHAIRGRGIAEQLIGAGEDAVRRAGCVYVRLEVRRDNESAIGLYRKLGYRLFGTYDNYYEDGEQALRFEKRVRFYEGPRADLFVPYFSQIGRAHV